ncbi:hypothetical protein Ct9H90mP29_07200 [bacterium]|nr:MAG: hypothetical protein Ct9H90mP29_07200 [bacterium]
MSQEDLNCFPLGGVCDLFDINAENSYRCVPKNDVLTRGKAKKHQPYVIGHYTEMLARDDIDAVIVATPDHWHSRKTFDAAKAGKNMFIVKKV